LTTVQYRVDGGVATLTLDRPDRLNAINGAMIDDMLATVERAAADESARALVLTGAGRAFSAGGDLRDGGVPIDGLSRDEAVANARSGMRLVEMLHSIPKPTVAAVNGPCAGAGIAWACACDIRVAAQSSFFRTAFVDAGLAGDYGISWLLPRVIGLGRATDLLLTGRNVSADEAERIGLVSLVVGNEELQGSALTMARALTEKPFRAIVDIKANLNDGQHCDLGQTIDRESERLIDALRRPDFKDAARTFLKSRRSR